MRGHGAWFSFVLAAGAMSASSCILFQHFDITETGGAGGATGSTTGDTSTDATGSTASSTQQASSGDATSVTSSASSGSTGVSGSSGSGGACACNGLVSAYRFTNAGNLGEDLLGRNDFPSVTGTPMQSPITPNGFPGNSLSLDGASSLCLDSGFTFDSTSDHTLCWWARPASLGDATNQFAQTCCYDTWTENNGIDYLWRINNCNGGTAIDLSVPNVYMVGQWVQICQTYTSAMMRREIVINGDTAQKTVQNDTAPILESQFQSWCIGSYGGGGFWNGLIYLPLWFNRVLSDTEIEDVYANACCL